MLNLTDKEFKAIQEYVKKEYGISLNNEKKSLVYSRLRTSIAELGMDTFSEYFDYLIKDKTGKAAQDFINRISTNHTFFMREKDHFDYLQRVVLPEVEKRHVADRDVRIWCPASSSGEEPYTLEIILNEYFEAKGSWDTTLLATDVSTKVLNLAYNGIYSKESLDVLPNGWVKKYFDVYKNEEGFYEAKDFLKKQIVFRRVNLMDDNLESKFSKKFSIIFCRNVMIYFDDVTRDNLVAKLYNMLEPGGYLFIGHSELVNQTKTPFVYVMPAVYKKEM